jgi:periplasmic mercuric ion binding protein
MKTITLVLITIAFVFVSASTAYSGDNEKATISVLTIQCGMCKKNITKALKNTEGVISVQVEIENKTAVVTYDDSKTNLSILENAITSAGYDANDKKADPAAYEKLDDCCKVPEKP